MSRSFAGGKEGGEKNTLSKRLPQFPSGHDLYRRIIDGWTVLTWGILSTTNVSRPRGGAKVKAATQGSEEAKGRMALPLTGIVQGLAVPSSVEEWVQ